MAFSRADSMRRAAREMELQTERQIGFTSPSFQARFPGRCKLTGKYIAAGDRVAFLADYGVCLAIEIAKHLLTLQNALETADYRARKRERHPAFEEDSLAASRCGPPAAYDPYASPEPHGWSCASDGRTS